MLIYSYKKVQWTILTRINFIFLFSFLTPKVLWNDTKNHDYQYVNSISERNW